MNSKRCRYVCFLHNLITSQALAWCEEVNALYRCGFYQLPQPIFASLGNSGTATTRRWNAHKTTKNLPMHHQTAALHAVLDKQAHACQGCRSGALGRLNIGKSGGVTEGREDFASFIWNSHLYVAGGRTTSEGPFHRDMWALDLNTLDAATGAFIGWTMLVHNDSALLFTGRRTVDLFNLASETWSSFQTMYTPTSADIEAGIVDGWPYPGRECCDATMVISSSKLYVFGGEHGRSIMGCNLFMELDLTTRVWRRLSGYVRAPQAADNSCPSPRKNAAGWASADGRVSTCCLGTSIATRAGWASCTAANETFGHEDFGVGGVREQRWRRERMSGNPPCARTELAYAYVCDRVRGYHPTLPTHVVTSGGKIKFEYSYFADTLIYDMARPIDSTEPAPASSKWQEVLTAGFPTYRCQAQLAVDSATGRTYMFGGWTNNQYIPTHTKVFSRSFGDVWELREEARVARAGPWQRCFACAAVGPWKSAGVRTCNGRVFFCGMERHKETHKCRKAK
ncbi:hypothetical protein B0H13DRAFT_2016515 [Mycena leptocephala]|nr:hypothetical protein B0H13DRAFT_2016515 [Mycena leptocephala]